MPFTDFIDDGKNYCKTDGGNIPGYDRSFYQRFIPIILVLSFQLIHVLYALYNRKQLIKLPKLQTIPYIILLIITALTNIQYFFKFIIIPFYMQSIVFNSTFCGVSAISEPIYLCIFHALVLTIRVSLELGSHKFF